MPNIMIIVEKEIFSNIYFTSNIYFNSANAKNCERKIRLRLL